MTSATTSRECAFGKTKHDDRSLITFAIAHCLITCKTTTASRSVVSERSQGKHLCAYHLGHRSISDDVPCWKFVKPNEVTSLDSVVATDGTLRLIASGGGIVGAIIC